LRGPMAFMWDFRCLGLCEDVSVTVWPEPWGPGDEPPHATEKHMQVKRTERSNRMVTSPAVDAKAYTILS
jgi:hypothetical protein